MIFLNVFDTEKPVYGFMASYMGNKVPVRIASALDDEWGSITVSSLQNEYYRVDFNTFSQYREEQFSPLPRPRIDDVEFWIDVNLLRLEAETCDSSESNP